MQKQQKKGDIRYMDIDINKFIEACEELCPGFTNKVKAKMKENNNAKFLQDKKNLTEQLCKLQRRVAVTESSLAVVKKYLNDLISKRSEVNKKCIAPIDQHIDNIITNARKAKATKKCIHSKKDAKAIKDAFEIVFRHFLPTTVFNFKDWIYEFKRFDSLVHNRCNTSVIFNTDFDLTLIVNILDQYNHSELGDKMIEIFNGTSGED